MISPHKTRSPRNPAQDGAKPTRLTFRLDELPALLGVSRRTIDRERAAGRFPQADLHIGKMPLWRTSTIERYVEGGAR